MSGIESIQYGPDGLVPAVVQDVQTRAVLMLGFMNEEMLQRTLQSGNVWFWSRARHRPWMKGETSGNYLRVREVRRNCEDNSLLVLAEPVGPVCHTGAPLCFYRNLDGTPVADEELETSANAGQRPTPSGTSAREGGLDWLYEIVRQRQRERQPEGSYVVSLLDKGVDRIAKKVGEEAAEVIIAAKNRSADELANEMADLWFHSLVLLADAGMTPEQVYAVLAQRHRERSPKSEARSPKSSDGH